MLGNLCVMTFFILLFFVYLKILHYNFICMYVILFVTRNQTLDAILRGVGYKAGIYVERTAVVMDTASSWTRQCTTTKKGGQQRSTKRGARAL